MELLERITRRVFSPSVKVLASMVITMLAAFKPRTPVQGIVAMVLAAALQGALGLLRDEEKGAK